MNKQVKVWLLSLAVFGFLYGCGGGQQAQNPTQPTTPTAQNQNPVAIIELTPATLETGTAISFDASKSSDPDGQVTKYSWQFPDGTKKEGAKVSYTFDKPGSYEIKLTVTDNKNAAIAATKLITVVDRTAIGRDEHLRLSKDTEIRIPWSGEPRNLLPEATEGTWESEMSALIFEPMLQTNTKLENIPGYANWDWDPDKLTFTFHIRPGIKFHDGVELTCDDVMFSFKAWMHPDYPGVRFDDFAGVVGAKDFRNRTFAKFPTSSELETALNSGTLPQAVRDAFAARKITLPEKIAVNVISDQDKETGTQNFVGWSVTDPATSKEYTLIPDGDVVRLNLPKGETIEWPIAGLKCLDKYTPWVQMEKIQRTFLAYVGASAGIMPKHVYEPYFEANGYDKLKGADLNIGKWIGVGPYKLAKWEPGQYIELERNDEYWQSREVEVDGQTALGGIEKLYFIFINDPSTQLAKLLANEVDVMDTRPSSNFYFQLKDSPNYTTYVFPQLTYDYWHWNFRNPLFQDLKVRQAMCSALNRQAMIDQTLRGLGEIANGPSHPLRWDWDPALREIHPQYNPQKTIQLMEEAGWTIEKNADGTIKKDAVWTRTTPDGKTMKMEFEIATNQESSRRKDYMVLMQEQLAALGFKTTTRVLDVNAFYNDYLDGTHNFQSAIAGWRLGTDPDGTSIWATASIDTSFNWMAYKNPEIDKLLAQGLLYVDIDKAKPIYQEIGRKLVETMGYCWLAFPSATYATKKGLLQLEPFSPTGPHAFISSWYWEGKGLPVKVKQPSTN